MKEGLKSIALATGIAAGGMLHPRSADGVEAQASQADKTCAIFDGTVLHQGEVHKDYQCVGSITTDKGHSIAIFKVYKSLGERGLYIIERDKKGQEWMRDFIELQAPNYSLPTHISVTDYSDKTYNLPLMNGWYTLPPTSTPLPSLTPTVQPTVRQEFYQPIVQPTPYPSNLQPTLEPMIEVLPHATEPVLRVEPVVKSTITAPIVEAAPILSAEYCIDSWGNQVELGVDRPGTDDCISKSVNVPNKGDITYTYQSEPDAKGNRSLIEVIVSADGKRYWDWKERDVKIEPIISPSEPPKTIVKKIQDVFAKLGSFFKIVDSAPVVKADPHLEAAQEYVYPTLEQLPKGIVTEATYSWYNTVVPIAIDLGYDPRTHLVFIDNETKGVNYSTSDQGAQGLVQIMPDTWDTIYNTIINNKKLSALAVKHGIDPYTMNVWDPKTNIFASGVYLVTYCRLPLGPMPPKEELDAYVESVSEAGIYYHDGPSSKKNFIEAAAKKGIYYTDDNQPALEQWTSERGLLYRQLILQLLPQFKP